jgi:transposase
LQRQGKSVAAACKQAGGKERRITRWEHEQVLETVQRRLDDHPEKMRQRRETVRHNEGQDGCHSLPDEDAAAVASELHVLAYNMTRVMSIMGVRR